MTHRWIYAPAPESTLDGAHLCLTAMAEAVREVIADIYGDAEVQAYLLCGVAGSTVLERIHAAMERVQRAYRWDRLDARQVGNRFARCREFQHVIDLRALQHVLHLELADDSTGREIITVIAIECPPDLVRQIREAV